MSPVHFLFLGQQLFLLPEKCLWWEDQKILIFSDLHIGKSAHFRKNGIPVPHSIHGNDLQVMKAVIDRYEPDRVLFLGDLFHSHSNEDVLDFHRILSGYPHVSFHLVLGNHDILPSSAYTDMQLVVHESVWEISPFAFAHDVATVNQAQGYLVTGHVHPMIVLQGKGRQTLRLPCFYFGKSHAVLPAYGSFKGGAEIAAKEGEEVFAVAKDKVIRVSAS
ncbi:MAG: ligase-associated DNA damage response endonuclease PdeM [Cytophagales bacterium]|nr:ligase-associated DNA damage response endonuclease PdeM [Cytophagales bacterium]